jgi:CRP/FNR family transcriptional regulator
MANYLRLASESVSRGFSRLQDAGLIRVDRREVEITDRPRLEAQAQNILRDPQNHAPA